MSTDKALLLEAVRDALVEERQRQLEEENRRLLKVSAAEAVK